MRAVLVLLLVAAVSGWARPAHADDSADPCESWAAEQALPYLLQAYAYTPYGLAGAGGGPQFQTPATPFGPGPLGPATLFAPPGLAPVYGPAGPTTAVPGLNGTVASFGSAAVTAANAGLAGANVVMGGTAAGQEVAGVGQAAGGGGIDLPLPPFLPGGLLNLARPGLNPNGGAVSATPPGTNSARFTIFRVALTTAHAQQSQVYALNQRYLASGHAQEALAYQRLSAAQEAQNTFDEAKAACQAHFAVAPLAAAAGTGDAADSTPPQP